MKKKRRSGLQKQNDFCSGYEATLVAQQFTANYWIIVRWFNANALASFDTRPDDALLPSQIRYAFSSYFVSSMISVRSFHRSCELFRLHAQVLDHRRQKRLKFMVWLAQPRNMKPYLIQQIQTYTPNRTSFEHTTTLFRNPKKKQRDQKTTEINGQ